MFHVMFLYHVMFHIGSWQIPPYQIGETCGGLPSDMHGIIPRFLQIRLGRESCDQISASPNKPKRAKSRDTTAGSLFTRAYTLVKFSQTKRCFFSFLSQNIQRQMIHQHHYRLHNTIHILLKTRLLFYSSCSFCLFCLRSTNAIERRH